MNRVLLYLLLSTILISNAMPSSDISGVRGNDRLLTGSLLLPAKQFQKQKSYPILIQLEIANGWHINSNQPLEDFLIPTEITFDEYEGVAFGKVRYEEPELRNFSFFHQNL